ncbi:MAG TPA: phosphotransferase [Pyrinomonadaceae bacterium]
MIIEEAAALIARHCPRLVVDSIERLGEGDFCVAYLVNNEWVFRFAKHERAAASLRREACLLPLISGRFDLRIPSPQLMDAGRSCALMRYPLLPGPALTRERYLRLSEAERERCAAQVAGFLAQLHAIEVSVAGRCGVEVADYSAKYEGLLVRAHEQFFEKLAGPEQAFVERTVEGYLNSQARCAFEPSLLHGDLSPDHVLYDERTPRVTAIIDFGDMVIGDPAWDLVFIYEDYGLDFFARLLRRYAAGESVALIERAYRFYVLAAIEWAVASAEEGAADFDEAVAQVGQLRARGEQEFQELLRACLK